MRPWTTSMICLALVGAGALALVAPPASADTCFDTDDVNGCDAHDCSGGEHLHIVYHRVGMKLHRCGPTLLA